ncbi:DUF6471 domain-containing protein [Aquabacterium sp.]|uniref:DUF6471 domain-containing protein n=1 Tax=Aquabacterium sp. TaxID=1872578 RepID=UPI00248A214E|nr:DUF6471 domain-containing protein [Aquabacterium sp.]MDI1258290.1 DUF6471 domain-containing protein [Aquabacterium sp.]
MLFIGISLVADTSLMPQTHVGPTNSRSKSATASVNWEAEAKLVLKAELARSGVSYKVLVARFEAMGIKDNELAIASRISRGKFSFAFFLQCMRALNVDEVQVRPRPSPR